MSQSNKWCFVLAIFFFCHSLQSVAQEDRDYFEVLNEINEYISGNEYVEALPLLNNLINAGRRNENIYYKLGLCYMNSARGTSIAITYFENAAKNIKPHYDDRALSEKGAPIKTLLYLGDAYRLNNHVDDAEIAYKRYLALVKDHQPEKNIALKRINECQMARLFALKPIDVKFEKLGPAINTKVANYNSCLSGDGKTMVFTRKMKFYDGIFCSHRTLNGWTAAENITDELGSDGDFWPTGVSVDGKRLLLITYDKNKGFDIYFSKYKNDRWTKVKKLNDRVNTPFNDIDGVFGPDGKSIYFSSNRNSGIGGYDLYTCTIDAEGNCGTPVNLGDVINTEWDEMSPTFTDDGKVLIFSSQRRPSMGGFDYFYATRDAAGKWQNVYNIGYPLNTLGDDIGLSTMLHSNEGVFAKYDPNGNADKCIYKVKLSNFSHFNLVPISGEIRPTGGEMSFKGTNLYFVDENTRDTVGIVEEPYAGKYNIDMYPGNFKLLLVKNEVPLLSQSFSIPSDSLPFIAKAPEYQLVSNVVAEPEKLRKGNKGIDTAFVFDIFFDFNQAEIKLQTLAELNKLVTTLKRHKITGIEFIGYADSVGNEPYNKKLSESRAENVQKFFADHGISNHILSAMGIGAANFLAKNKNSDGTDNTNGRAYNRRVEIYITSVEKNLVIIKRKVVPQQLVR